MTKLKGFVCLTVGVLFGAIGFSALRVMQYKLLDWQPNMAPEMFVLFSPVLALPIAFVALVVHLGLWPSFAYRKPQHWLLAGITYSSVFVLLISLWLLPVVILGFFFVFRKALKRPS